MPPDFPPSYFTFSLSSSTLSLSLSHSLSPHNSYFPTRSSLAAPASGNASKRIKDDADDCWKVAIALKRQNYKSAIAAGLSLARAARISRINVRENNRERENYDATYNRMQISGTCEIRKRQFYSELLRGKVLSQKCITKSRTEKMIFLFRNILN